MKTDTDTFQYDRAMPASADKMWHLMTSTEGRAAWGAPEEGQVLEVLKSDFRVGGEDHQRCGPEDAPEFEVTTRWYNIAAPTDATFSEQIHAGGMTLGGSFVTYKITPTDSGSHVSVTVAVSSFVGPEMIAEFRAGWDGGMAKLETLAA